MTVGGYDECVQGQIIQLTQICQGQNSRGWNSRGQRNRVIDKSILWNGVIYYVGEEYYLAIV